ncbi:peptide-methionine (S)-S-oxide reductase MsrA [Candidatus Methylopumilus rimovensis]|jgi:methionine-S-sulfoxide reductase|uniref:peptide-methionine (S)-S-oxide reductase MsrA n=1 Tax=Candidatus Methylopumilus rimovensis TaxID=2588535 RepID=UPI00111D57AA|nr:peptide-methionine (S)-S-oxide reductase MsrA [Candidatus Methylopumilus rimovensis]QDD12368.1 peptide-methionine (S)-S-oxide reductase MsrA [Candidatus Methylopumilus rimovensis]
MANETVYLAGGCYWGLENLLSEIPGVVDTTVGFSGGHVKNVCYREVTTGTTGHAETVKVVFDSDILSFKDLLLFFFKIHDPTTLNQQGNDLGTQYRSAIFATNNEQIMMAEDLIKKIDASGALSRKITTEVITFSSFFPAEENHQKYLKKYPDGYSCHFLRDINWVL